MGDCMANAEIVSVGSEFLFGQIVDTNAVWLTQRLSDLGINLFYKNIVGDNPTRMIEVIKRALGRPDIVITGGGLGLTQDDITREIVANITGQKLIKGPTVGVLAHPGQVDVRIAVKARDENAAHDLIQPVENEI